jgi:hypothetical protein
VKAHVIHLHPEAPPKPPVGAACNGCGVCCALEPCPLGRLLSMKRHGRCRLLRWDDAARRYSGSALAGSRLRRRLVARWIAAGRGCDAELQVLGAAD